jgi:4'-phosphopantetheinyl transferase
MLAPNEVHAWYRVTDELSDAAMDAALSILSPAELAYHDRLRSAVDRRDYAAAHALVRTSLSHYSDISPEAWLFESDRLGKPRLSRRHGTAVALTFSLSHARGLVTCAIASGAAVGIDVERENPTVEWQSVAQRFFSASEIAQLHRCAASDRIGRFAEIWTLKEAYAKATGLGLSDSWPTFGFEGSGGDIRFTPPAAVDAGSWQFATFTPVEQYRLAVAVERTGDEMLIRNPVAIPQP